MTATVVCFEAATFAVDKETRTLRGRLLPFGEISRPTGDPKSGKVARFTFADGDTIDLPEDTSEVILNYGHDNETLTAQVGVAVELTKQNDGIHAAFRIARTPEGDRILALSEDRILKAFSAEVEGEFSADEDGINHAVRTILTGGAVVRKPAFTGAQITSVAASAAHDSTNRKEPTMGDENTPETVEAPDFSAVTEAITQGFASIKVPAREEVKASAHVTSEPLPYRFDGSKGDHGFLADIVAAKFGSGDAGTRLTKFLAEAFASVTTGNVAGLNPVPTRPELYVDNLHYSRPLWNLVTTGTLDDITAFIIPKFSSAAGLVGDHTQGTEPTEGSFTATTQTITPTALSGKAILNREVVDQGGNPKVDSIIWNEMVAGYYDGIEESIQTVLNGVATAEQNFGAGADDKAKVALLKAFLTSLQFVKGGDRFSAFAADPTLYGGLSAAVDTTGRPLLPIYGPTNADGSMAPSMESIGIAGKRAVPAWALNETVANAEESYLFVPSSVYAWASAPRRIDIEYKVATVEVGIWGYKAAAVTRDSDVQPIDWTTADV